MTAKEADSGAAWENPLMPNARLRQMLVAMMRARTLARVVARRRGERSTVGLEACLVSPAMDLGPGDLVSDTLGGGVVEFLRGAKLGQALRPGLASNKGGMTAAGGAAARLPSGPGIDERIWAALGAAATLKSQAARAKADSAEAQMGVVVVYLMPGEIRPALWRKALTFAKEQELPALFVVLPPVRAKGDAGAAIPKFGALSAGALRLGVPGITVDADDAVALYRVGQESIGHARAGGGAALMECVPFAVDGAKRKSVDAIAGLEEYMVGRGVVSKAWMEGQAKSFARRVGKETAASK